MVGYLLMQQLLYLKPLITKAQSTDGEDPNEAWLRMEVAAVMPGCGSAHPARAHITLGLLGWRRLTQLVYPGCRSGAWFPILATTESASRTRLLRNLYMTQLF